MAELEGQQKPAAPTVSEPRPPAPAVANVPAGADPAQIEKAREAMRQKMQALDAEQQAPAMATLPPAADPAAVEKARAAVERQISALNAAERPAAPPKSREDGFEPMPAPPLPISAEKQQQLSDLLRRYKADELTPEQYHVERAKILGAQ